MGFFGGSGDSAIILILEVMRGVLKLVTNELLYHSLLYRYISWWVGYVASVSGLHFVSIEKVTCLVLRTRESAKKNVPC